MKRIKGISLIVLVITIIVIIILAGTILLTLANDNPIQLANDAKFKMILGEYESELLSWITSEFLSTSGELDLSSINATKDSGTYTKDSNVLKLKDIITIMLPEHEDIFEISEGKLVYVGVDPVEIQLVSELNVEVAVKTLPAVYTDVQIDDMVNNQGYIPIANATELNNLRSATQQTFGLGTTWENEYISGVDKKYIQVANINLNLYSTGEGWNPIYSEEDGYFHGIYDGNNYKISNLYINRPGNNGGVFMGVGSTGFEFKNIVINNIDVKNSLKSGALLGSVENGPGLVTNVHSSGDISNTTGSTGGLIGYIYTDVVISNCSSSVNIVASNQSVGGLIGENYGKVSTNNSYATGNITGGNNTGGLIGTNYSIIENCYATGTVTGTGSNYIGGLIGSSNNNIENSYATGNVIGENYIGGLAGSSSNIILNCYAIGTVTGNNDIGGLVGYALGVGSPTISTSYATGIVNGNDNIGGLLGRTGGVIVSTSYATGIVNGNDIVGGLIGNVGGGEIKESYATGNIIGRNVLGGLVGVGNSTEIKKSYAMGTVKGNNSIGGLVGTSGGTIVNISYATGSIEGVNNVGGLIGSGGGATITNSYAINNITSTGQYVGGLVGSYDGASVINSYAVNDILTGVSNVGGIIGGPYRSGPPSFSSYWNSEINDIHDSANLGYSTVYEKTTIEMHTQATYIGWDFTTIWQISAGVNNGYPTLK